MIESSSSQSKKILSYHHPFEHFKDSVNSQSQTSLPKISTNIQFPGQASRLSPPVVQIPTTLNPLIAHPIQAMAQPPTRMELIVAVRYVPLVLPQPFHPLPQGDYLKYLPKFMREGMRLTAEEHLDDFYSYVDNKNIENEDVWTHLFVQSMDGEVGKWFRDLPVCSIAGIEALDESFLKQWGDQKDYLYYIIGFGSLKRKEGETLIYFTKQFNKVY